MKHTEKKIPVYLAGRIKEERVRFGLVDSTLVDTEYLYPSLPEASFTRAGIDFRFTGPFTISCDHRCSHIGLASGGIGTRSHGAASPFCSGETDFSFEMINAVFNRSKQGIDEAQVVFAWIDDYEAFGTIWELGYADAQDKLVVIGCPFDIPNSGELWFPLMSADWIINESSPEKAFEAFCQKLLHARDILAA
jgi:hypothetical protein